MTLRLRDTLSGRPEALSPGEPVTIYVCGITPYDATHVGHAFTYVQFDSLVRVLEWLGHEVRYVQNVTDVDDSILHRAREIGVDWRRLGDEQLARYLADMRELDVRSPTRLVRATEAIPGIQTLGQRLIERDAAYVVAAGSVFFRAASSPRYGALSGLQRDQMLGIAAEQDDADLDDPRKEDPLDVAIWKAWSGDSAEPRWASPWGEGRPGWHVECAAIIAEHLGSQITIHGGGSDLIFPHHETELAIMEAATGARPFVEHWLTRGWSGCRARR